MIGKDSIVFKNGALLLESRIPKITVCGVKVGNIKLF